MRYWFICFLDWLIDRPRLAGALVVSIVLAFVFAINYGLALIGYPTSKWVMEMLGVL